jgi:branched-chain amino acid transport system ATP-binding protein
MLKLENISVYYNKALAIDNISIEIKKDEAVCVLGSNGAGKTSLLNAIFNIVHKTGRVFFKGIDISTTPTHKIADMGMVYVPDKRTVFNELSVFENLEVAAHKIIKEKGRGELDKNLDAIFEQFGNLYEKRMLQAGYLSGGEQQMLSVAQGLIRAPEMFVMDEPTAGLSPKLMDSVFDFISFMRTQHITILIVEQNVNKTLKATDRAYIMEVGRIVDSGPSKDFLDSESIKKAYLGG